MPGENLDRPWTPGPYCCECQPLHPCAAYCFFFQKINPSMALKHNFIEFYSNEAQVSTIIGIQCYSGAFKSLTKLKVLSI